MNILAAFLTASQSGNATPPAANASAGPMLVFADVMQQVSAVPWGQPIGHGKTGTALEGAMPILQGSGPSGLRDDELPEGPPVRGGLPLGENADAEGLVVAAAQILDHFPKEYLPGSPTQRSASVPAAPPPFMHLLSQSLSQEADDVPLASGGEVATQVTPATELGDAGEASSETVPLTAEVTSPVAFAGDGAKKEPAAIQTPLLSVDPKAEEHPQLPTTPPKLGIQPVSQPASVQPFRSAPPSGPVTRVTQPLAQAQIPQDIGLPMRDAGNTKNLAAAKAEPVPTGQFQTSRIEIPNGRAIRPAKTAPIPAAPKEDAASPLPKSPLAEPPVEVTAAKALTVIGQPDRSAATGNPDPVSQPTPFVQARNAELTIPSEPMPDRPLIAANAVGPATTLPTTEAIPVWVVRRPASMAAAVTAPQESAARVLDPPMEPTRHTPNPAPTPDGSRQFEDLMPMQNRQPTQTAAPQIAAIPAVQEQVSDKARTQPAPQSTVVGQSEADTILHTISRPETSSAQPTANNNWNATAATVPAISTPAAIRLALRHALPETDLSLAPSAEAASSGRAHASAPASVAQSDSPSNAPTPKPFAEALLTQIKSAEVSEGRTLVNLHPRGLGAVSIEVISEQDAAAKVIIRADNPAVAQALRDERQLLAQAIGLGDGATLEFSDHSRGNDRNGSDPAVTGALTTVAEPDTEQPAKAPSLVRGGAIDLLT